MKWKQHQQQACRRDLDCRYFECTMRPGDSERRKEREKSNRAKKESRRRSSLLPWTSIICRYQYLTGYSTQSYSGEFYDRH